MGTGHVEGPTKKPEPDALTLAEEAEAEAAEAEALAAAARARARALRLRREAQAAEVTPETDAETEASEADDPAVVAEQAEEAEEAEEAEAPEAEVPTVERPSGRRWGRIFKVAAISLALLCTAALLAASAYMVWHHREAAADQKLTAEYAAAARQSVVTLMSLDFNKVEEDVQRIIDNSTGQFKEDFEAQAEDFVKVAQDSKVVTDVTVTATAVETMDEKSAVALVSATSRVSNAAGAKQEPRAWRLSVDLERDGGQIKMSKVEFVP
ncbi:hypothetical protein ABQE89_20260 [Mycolicibacterium sp. XJ1819]